ncbi:hypothetical protein FQN54_002927 [Arachnomyces sp. PD_36]|nr:hypothetical protein FQN54_002927 [Arachnomyces sp. PD_36]
MVSQLTTPPPSLQHALISFPTPNILLVTLNRPESLNCINSQGHAELHELWEWMDAEPSLRAGILTGKGRAFCAGADLKEWNNSQQGEKQQKRDPTPASGFGGVSRRTGKKPIICAVNGLAFGGGCEIIINADMVVACASNARFSLPEVKRGVVAIAGGLPRLTRIIGRQRAMEMSLTGRVVSAQEAQSWGLVNAVVEGGAEKVVAKAIEMAEAIAENSPDAVIITREGVKLGWEGVGAEEGSRILIDGWAKKLNDGENIKEGVKAFVEKRKPNWVPSKL